MKIFAVALASAFLLFCKSAFAQDDKKAVVCNGDIVEYFEQERKVVGTGNVVIDYEDVKLTADKAVVYIDTKDAYCEGNVVLYQEEGIFTGERIVYNFETKKGRLVKGAGVTPPVYEKSEETDKVGEKEVMMRRGYITTCEFEKPHYRIQSKSISVFLGDKVVARNALFFVGNYPIMWFPRYRYSLIEDRPHILVIPGYDKQWGMFVLTKTRYEINADAKGNILLDYREKRDFASGLDYIYKTKKFGKGKLRLYYMDERKLTDRIYSDTRTLEREHERFRVQLRHKWRVDKNTLGIFEYHRMTDDTFIKDYYYREEYEKQKTPESYASVISTQEYYTLSFLAKKRINRFETVTEEVPKISLDLRSYEIGNSKFYYKGDMVYDALNTKTAQATSEDVAESKFSTYNQLSYASTFPRFLDWISFTPYVGTKQVLHSRDTTGADRYLIQGGYYSGWDIFTKFYRLFGVRRKFWGTEINGLRHVITPRWNYNYTHRPSAPNSKFASGEISATNTYLFSLENKFQTKWLRNLKDETTKKLEEELKPEELKKYLRKLKNVDIVDLVRQQTSVNYFPHDTEVKQLSNITSNLEIRPRRWFLITNDATYNPYTRDFETVAVDLKARKQGKESLGRDLDGNIRDKWTIGFGHRYQQNTNTQETMQLGYQFNPKWKIDIYERFEAKKFIDGKKKINIFEEQQYILTRDMHCWVAELTYSVRRGYGEAIWLIFRLKAFPELPLELEQTYNERKISSQSGV